MSESYLFFNSYEGDERLISAEDFAGVFSTVISDGLIHKDGQPMLQVKKGLGNSIIVDSGVAFIKGHPYERFDEKTLSLDVSDETYDRIDRVVLRLDNRIDARYIKLFVLKGVPSTSPKAPTLTRNDDVFELSLAQVLVKSKSVGITSVDITDERLNATVCGLATSLISVPIEKMESEFATFKKQLNDQYNETIGNLGGELEPVKFSRDLKNTKLNQLELLIERDIEGQSSTMDEGYFFDSLKNTEKVDLDKTTASVDTDKKYAKANGQSLTNELYWKKHSIDFVTNKVTHLHTRPVNILTKAATDALAGQNKIKIEQYKMTVTEVIG